MKKILLILIPALALVLAPKAVSAPYIDEEFDYPNGALGSPWTFVNLTGNSSVTVENAVTLNGFTPPGKDAAFSRPTTGDGAVAATLATGQNDGTEAWSLASGDKVHLTLNFSFSAISNNQSFAFTLRGGAVNFFGVRVQGIAGGNTAVQYLTTNQSSSYTNIPDTPSLGLNTWYQLSAVVTIVDANSSVFDLSLTQLGTGGGLIYSETGLALESASNFGTTTDFRAAYSAGTPAFKIADLYLDAVPEPNATTMVLLGSMGLAVHLMPRRTRRVSV